MKKVFAMILLAISFVSFSVNVNDIKIKDFNNNEITLGEIKGKKVIRVWFTWCYACRKGMPDYISLTNDKDKDFEVLALSLPGSSDISIKDILKRIKESKYDKDGLKAYYDENDELQKRVGKFRGHPTNVLIDSKGNFVKMLFGPVSSEIIKKEMSKIK